MKILKIESLKKGKCVKTLLTGLISFIVIFYSLSAYSDYSGYDEDDDYVDVVITEDSSGGVTVTATGTTSDGSTVTSVTNSTGTTATETTSSGDSSVIYVKPTEDSTGTNVTSSSTSSTSSSSGGSDSSSSSSSRADNDESTATDKYRHFSPGYENNVSTAELRAHLAAVSLAKAAASGCQGQMCQRTLALERTAYYRSIDNYYDGDSPDEVLARGPMEANLMATQEVSDNIFGSPSHSDQDDYENDYIDRFVRAGKAEVYFPSDASPIDLEGLQATQILGMQNSAIVIVDENTLRNNYYPEDYGANEPVSGYNMEHGNFPGGITLATTDKNGNINLGTRVTIAHESYHAGERIIISAEENLTPSEIENIDGLKEGAAAATALNSLVSDAEVLSEVHLLTDEKFPAVMSQPGNRFNVNYSNTLSEARAYLSEGGISGSDETYWRGIIQSDYDMSEDEAQNVINSFKRSQVLRSMIKDMDRAAEGLLGAM